jgi:hypothetical protein
VQRPAQRLINVLGTVVVVHSARETPYFRDWPGLIASVQEGGSITWRSSLESTPEECCYHLAHVEALIAFLAAHFGPPRREHDTDKEKIS